MTSVNPTRAQVVACTDLPRNAPARLVNLLRLRDRADHRATVKHMQAAVLASGLVRTAPDTTKGVCG